MIGTRSSPTNDHFMHRKSRQFLGLGMGQNSSIIDPRLRFKTIIVLVE